MSDTNKSGCMVDTHDDGYIVRFCLDKDCEHHSRSICLQCSIEEANNHSNCEVFLKFNNINDFSLQFQNLKSYNIDKFYEDIETYEQSLCREIEDNYDSLITSLTEKILQIKTRVKEEVLSRYIDIKKQMKEFLEKQQEFTDISIIQDKFNEYKNQNLDMNKFNEILKEKQKENSTRSEKQDMVDSYNQIEKQSFYQNTIQNLQKDLFQYLDNLNPLYSYHTYSEPQICKMYTPTFAPFEDYKYRMLESGKNSYVVKEQANLRSLQKFNKNDLVFIKFRLNLLQQNKNWLAIGITSFQSEKQDFWFDSGIQLSLTKRDDSNNGDNNNKGLKQLGELKIDEVFRDGQVYELIFIVRENIFVLQTEDKKCVIQNDCQLEQDIEDWAIVISMDKDQQIQIL